MKPKPRYYFRDEGVKVTENGRVAEIHEEHKYKSRGNLTAEAVLRGALGQMQIPPLMQPPAPDHEKAERKKKRQWVREFIRDCRSSLHKLNNKPYHLSEKTTREYLSGETKELHSDTADTMAAALNRLAKDMSKKKKRIRPSDLK